MIAVSGADHGRSSEYSQDEAVRSSCLVIAIGGAVVGVSSDMTGKQCSKVRSWNMEDNVV